MGRPDAFGLISQSGNKQPVLIKGRNYFHSFFNWKVYCSLGGRLSVASSGRCDSATAVVTLTLVVKSRDL